MHLNKIPLAQGRVTARALGAVVIALLLAVPALGLTTLGPTFLTAWEGARESSPSTPDGGVSANPLTFDAPTTTMLRLRPAGRESAQSAPEAGAVAGREDVILFKDWKFTQLASVSR